MSYHGCLNLTNSWNIFSWKQSGSNILLWWPPVLEFLRYLLTAKNDYSNRFLHKIQTVYFYLHFFSESDPGFISNVSPMKKAKKGTQYYHCTLQTSPTKAWRVVGFDQATHTQCQHYEKTGNPVKLLNVKEDNGQFLVNQTTTLLQMTNSDVTFTSTPSSSLSDNAKQSSPAVASNITLNQLPTLTRNQKVNVTGISWPNAGVTGNR